LLQRKQKRFIAEGRDTRIRIGDERINQKLARQKLTWASVPPRGEPVYLLENANLSSGGEAHDVTEDIHPAYATLAIRLAKDMGLRLCGVDLMVDGDISEKPGRFVVLEINAAPGLDHYAQAGKAQEKIVERMYLKVLRAME
jgi:D-alanine-D-alanine ligase-like ATP-grasp enzyme